MRKHNRTGAPSVTIEGREAVLMGHYRELASLIYSCTGHDRPLLIDLVRTPDMEAAVGLSCWVVTVSTSIDATTGELMRYGQRLQGTRGALRRLSGEIMDIEVTNEEVKELAPRQLAHRIVDRYQFAYRVALEALETLGSAPGRPGELARQARQEADAEHGPTPQLFEAQAGVMSIMTHPCGTGLV